MNATRIATLLLILSACSRRDAGTASDAGAADGARRDADLPLVGSTDTDRDGLPDETEARLGTSPYVPDTDADGVPDLVEVEGSHTDPLDPHDTIPDTDFYVNLPYGDPPQTRDLAFGTRLEKADVYFLVDTTNSMQAAIDDLRSSLTTIVSRISVDVHSVQTGVGHFEDFPFEDPATPPPSPFTPPGTRTGEYGELDNVAYENLHDIGDDVPAVVSAIGGLVAHGGADGPEADVEALYQVATGEGGTWTNLGHTYSVAPKTCTGAPDDTGPRRGYPCFRPGALPVVVHVTDSAFHNSRGPYYHYAGVDPTPHGFDDAADALNDLGARYIGIAVDAHGRDDLEMMALATGSADTAGRPLVFDAPGGVVADPIVTAIETLVSAVPQDVSTDTRDVPGNPDGIDATRFITGREPIEGVAPTGESGPLPGVTYDRKDATTFYRLIPGTAVTFRVTFENRIVMPTDSARIYRAQILVVGNHVATLSVRQVYIVVPPVGWTLLI